MNISETVDRIIELRRQGAAPERRIAEFLDSTLLAAGADVQIQSFTFSVHSRAFIGAVVFLLSIAFLLSHLKRRHRAALLSAFAIVLILFLELSAHIHVVSWPVTKKSENVIAHFPVQDPARRIIVGTHLAGARYREPGTVSSERFADAVSAFLLPMTLVVGILGLWQLAMCFGKFDFEDAHTIILIMGFVCLVYYALLFGTSLKGNEAPAARPDSKDNAGSIAVLAALAQDLSQKYPRLQNTGVTVAFFGGGNPDGQGAKSFARGLMRKKSQGLPTYFIECEQIGRGGPHGYVVPANAEIDPFYADRELVRTLNRAAVAATGRHLEIIPGAVADPKGFGGYGCPTVALATLPPERQDTRGGSRPQEIDRGQLLLTLQLIEAMLAEFEKSQFR